MSENGLGSGTFIFSRQSLRRQPCFKLHGRWVQTISALIALAGSTLLHFLLLLEEQLSLVIAKWHSIDVVILSYDLLNYVHA